MGFYQFKREQLINRPVEEIWDFIANPNNLQLITPDYMGFHVTSEDLPKKMYPGLIISYRVAPLLRIKTTWVTEITQIKEREYFIDEQRVGPYKIWHHQHFLIATDQGTLMKDIVSYQPPFGILGSLANKLIIQHKLKEIFDYRSKVLLDIFN